MIRPALLATMLLLPTAVSADQTVDESYEACLVGHYVMGVVLDDMPTPDAYYRAVGMCEGIAAQIPEDFCTGESCGPGSVSEGVIHFIDGILVERLGLR